MQAPGPLEPGYRGDLEAGAYQTAQTAQIPVIPPPFPPDQARMPPPGGMLPMPQPPGLTPEIPPAGPEGREFEELARGRAVNWRLDFKWVFGVIAVVFIFAALTSAGFYRVTGSGSARDILSPIVEKATEVEEKVEDNYSVLRGKARKNKRASISIPDVGVDVSIDAETINSLGMKDLADAVVQEIEKQIYSKGYEGDLPMEKARGVGEERDRAIVATMLAMTNNSNHRNLLWPLGVASGIALAFMILMIVLCRGWGRLAGPGLAFIAAAALGSIFIRIASAFFWKAGSSGVYREASHQALRGIGSLILPYYDIALGFGALLLVAGLIGGAVSRRSSRRVPPFIGLESPGEHVVGGPSIDEMLRKQQDAGFPVGGGDLTAGGPAGPGGLEGDETVS